MLLQSLWRYEGASYFNFKEVFSKLDYNLHDSVFVDLGCGRGRALIQAAELGFKKVIGVEFAEELYVSALQNILKVTNLFKDTSFEVLHEDATTYLIPDEADTFFLYNPFNAHGLNKVLDNLEKSLKKATRDVYLVYMIPIHEECIEHRGFKKIVEIKKRKKLEAVVYKKHSQPL